jgi:hypothetical protein
MRGYYYRAMFYDDIMVYAMLYTIVFAKIPKGLAELPLIIYSDTIPAANASRMPFIYFFTRD